MTILIVSDIFGQQHDLDDFACSLKCNEPIIFIDPYQGRYHHFTNEEHAYQTFLQHCGHDDYANIICDILNNITNNNTAIMIIAFSAGASATWRALARLSLNKQANIKYFVGFYPSQIRHHLNLTVNYPTRLFFPQQEMLFSVDSVINVLKKKPSIRCIKTVYLHGFMNPLSINFNLQAKLLYIQELQKIISNTRFLGS